MERGGDAPTGGGGTPPLAKSKKAIRCTHVRRVQQGFRSQATQDNAVLQGRTYNPRRAALFSLIHPSPQLAATLALCQTPFSSFCAHLDIRSASRAWDPAAQATRSPAKSSTQMTRCTSACRAQRDAARRARSVSHDDSAWPAPGLGAWPGFDDMGFAGFMGSAAALGSCDPFDSADPVDSGDIIGIRWLYMLCRPHRRRLATGCNPDVIAPPPPSAATGS